MPTDGNSRQQDKPRRLTPKEMIADYLNKTLNPSDNTFFEEEMKSDPNLLKLVLLQKKIKYAFDHPDLEDDIKLIQQAKNNVETESKIPALLLVGLFLIVAVGLVALMI